MESSKIFGTKSLKGVLKFLLFVLGMIFISESANATHIVGGEIRYKCLGNNEYEIILSVYRDCYLGQAPYDDPAWVGLFDSSGNLLDTLAMKFTGDTDTLFNADICLFVPPSLCVERFTYRDTVSLPFIAGGYTLTYQRCCRNQTIVNIVDPLQKGATYTVKITEDALKDCNNAPAFKNWPPIFVCVNKQIVFDHSASDMDGDSLVYKLCVPYDGGTYIINPKPIPPAPPPYDTIVWNPAYSLQNLLGGTDPLKVDPVTGLMTGTPVTIGQFVVGVCVEEYRNGKLYSTVRRDFQYNVVNCTKIESSWTASNYNNCDNKTITFKNNSTLSNNFKWFYKDIHKGSGDVLFSTMKEPSLTVPDTGTYQITLVAEPTSICSDTLKQLVYFKSNTLDADFDIQVINCLDSITIQMLDKSTDLTSPVVKWNWSLTHQGGTITSTEKNPKFTLFGSTKVKVQLIAETQFGCLDTLTKEFQANILQLDTLNSDTIDICKYEAVYLNPTFFPDYTYTWVPVTGLIPPDGTIPNPLASPGQTTTYTMVYTDSTGLCNIAQNITIFVLRSVDSFDFDIKIPECSKDIKIVIDNVKVNSATGTGNLTWEWVLTSPYGTQISTLEKPVFTIPGPGFVTITGVATTSDSCKYEVKKSIQANVIPKNTSPSEFKICQGDCVEIYPGADNGWIYTWQPPAGLDNTTSANPTACPGITTKYFVDYTDSVGLCIVKDTVNVIVSDSTLGVNFTFDVECNGRTVKFINTSSPGVTDFHWNFGDPAGSTSTVANPSFTYAGPGTYIVLLYTKDINVCRDSIYEAVVLEDDPIIPDFDYTYENCIQNGFIAFTDQSVSKYGTIDSWKWTVNGTEFSTQKNPKYTFTTPGNYNICLYISVDNGACTDTICKNIDVQYLIINIPASVTSCSKDSVQLNPNGNPAYTYQWSPCINLSDCTVANPTAYHPFTEPFYSVTITYVLPNGDTCFTVKQVEVVKDSVFAQIMNDSATCSNAVSLFATNLVNVASINWYKLDGTFLGTGNGLSVPLTGNEKFVMVLTSPKGCTFTDTVFITKLQNIVVEISADITSFCEASDIQLSATNNPNYTFEWQPASLLNDATIYNPVASKLSESTLFTVTVKDNNGCEGQASISINKLCPLCEDPFIYVPNAFSPNGDGKNDVLYVRGESIIEEMDFIIYNRWGQQVFASRDPKTGWDGTFKGEKLGPDVFGYHLKAKCFDGQTYTQKGNVSIIR